MKYQTMKTHIAEYSNVAWWYMYYWGLQFKILFTKVSSDISLWDLLEYINQKSCEHTPYKYTDEKFVHFSKLSTVHVLYTAKVRNHLKTSKYKYITINKFWSVNRLYINTI